MVWHLTLDMHAESVLANFADLLAGPASRRALAQRDIAAVYRMLRDEGISQASIAQATGQKQSEVSEIISGRQVQSVVLLERIADGLGVPRGWMGLAYEPDPTATAQDEPHQLDRALFRFEFPGVEQHRPVFRNIELLTPAERL